VSRPRQLTRLERAIATAAGVLVALAVVAAVAKPLDPATTPSDVPSLAPAPDPDDPPAGAAMAPGVGAATTTRPAIVRVAPLHDAPEVSALREGIVLPVSEQRDGFFAVLTPCQVRGWVWAEDVRTHPPAAPGRPGAFHLATIVVDPGHGGGNPGAVGPGGLSEKAVNLDIALRLRDLLGAARDVDTDTGAVRDGSSYGAPRVLLTLDQDFTAALTYRTQIASRLGAHAFVSIHNNAEPDGPSPRPGTETYYQHRSSESKRLAGLAYEELVRTFGPYDVPWVADRDAGTKVRISSRGDDYYAVLRQTSGPAVLIEGLFISNPPEEALLADAGFRQAYAEALYRSLVRYITTDDPGSGFIAPYPRGSGPSGGLGTCVDPR
jgi:N-acetylmuramoyl-L-alanine amidase